MRSAAPAAKGRNLILGTVDGYEFHDIEPFLATLRQSGFDGHVCLFAGPNIGARTAARLRDSGCEVIPFRSEFPFVDAPHPDCPRQLPASIYIYNYRHFLYYDYLLKKGDRFANVLLADVRDVVFQADPFSSMDRERISVAMESRAITVGQCRWTREWILAGYGSGVLERLENRELSCAGTTMGPTAAIKRYLELMLEQIASMKDAFDCADQAAHNLLLHDGLLEPARRLYNFEGPILTVGSEPQYRLDSEQRLVNRDGSVIAVIHQYDRHKGLRRLIARKVRPNPVSRTLSDSYFWLKRRARRYLAPLRRSFRQAVGADPAGRLQSRFG